MCTFFPDSWSEEKILSEVEYVAQNVERCENIKNGYVGLSSDGKIRIVIQYKEYYNKEGVLVKIITSYYPLFE